MWSILTYAWSGGTHDTNRLSAFVHVMQSNPTVVSLPHPFSSPPKGMQQDLAAFCKTNAHWLQVLWAV